MLQVFDIKSYLFHPNLFFDTNREVRHLVFSICIDRHTHIYSDIFTEKQKAFIKYFALFMVSFTIVFA